MLFNSYIYILIFLPLTVSVYFLLNRKHLTTAAKTWLLGASLLFYGYWNIVYLPLLLTSIGVNFMLGSALGQMRDASPPIHRKSLLAGGIVLNLGLLFFFKYSDFFIENINAAAAVGIEPLGIILPIGISFFTFQQIAFLVDSYRAEVREYDLLNYSLFVSFFPQLIAGPIVHHKEMMPQFAALRNKLPNAKNIYEGLTLFSIGLAKKAFIADGFAKWADAGFNSTAPLHMADAWIASLSYTFQLYFDFSGYMDMALGAALLLNIRLPINFNAPYQATSIQDFWRRWHITLGRFLLDYLYIPLGGNKKGTPRTLINLFTVFLIGGLWHGAAWTFVAWGAFHGLGMATHAIWRSIGMRLPKGIAWLTTFLFVNTGWVLFRAESFEQAIGIMKSMIGINGVVLHGKMQSIAGWLPRSGLDFGAWKVGESGGTTLFAFYLIIFGLIGCLLLRPARELLMETPPSFRKDLWAVASFVLGFISLSRVTEFIYFQF